MINAVPYTYQTAVVSNKLFDEHVKLYNDTVEKVNEITQSLRSDPGYDTANQAYSFFRGLKNGECFTVNGVILHELYFQNIITNPQPSAPGKKMRHMIDRYWGGYDRWREDITACGKAAKGWALCVYEQRTDACMNIVLDAHDQGNIATAYPLIAMDIYEHAYFLDFGADKNLYIDRFLNNIPWDVIEKRASAVLG